MVHQVHWNDYGGCVVESILASGPAILGRKRLIVKTDVRISGVKFFVETYGDGSSNSSADFVNFFLAIDAYNNL